MVTTETRRQLMTRHTRASARQMLCTGRTCSGCFLRTRIQEFSRSDAVSKKFANPEAINRPAAVRFGAPSAVPMKFSDTSDHCFLSMLSRAAIHLEQHGLHEDSGFSRRPKTLKE